MSARVDAAAGAVVDGDRSWPLRLDARTGGAVVTVDGRELAVTPLGWRHKQRLAGWALLGEGLVADQRVALALDPGTALADDERAVVGAVVRFLDGDGLPLTPEVLGEVTMELCRATGLPPAAFDDRDARDVEVMWRSAAGAGPGRQPAVAMPPTTARSGPAFDDWATGTSIVFTGDVDPPSPLEDRAHPEASPTAHATTPDVPPHPVGSVPSTDPPRSPSPLPREGHREVTRYRVAPTSPPTRRPRSDAGAGLLPAPSAAPSRTSGAPSRGRSSAAAGVTPSPAGDGPGPHDHHPVATLSRRGPAVGDVDGYAVAPHPLTAAIPVRVSTPLETATNARPAIDLDALAAEVTDRIAEQLAEAADDLGVGV